MKKIYTIISVISLFLLVSCEKNVITFGTTDVDQSKSAQIRLVYDLPIVPSGTTYNITRLAYNDQMVSEVSTSLGSILPNSVAKYHVVPVGDLKIDAFKGSAKTDLQYTSTIQIAAGRWSAFVYQPDQAPLLVPMPNEFPSYDPWADTVCTIQFVNLFHKADGVTPYGKLYLKGRRGAGTTSSPYQYIDIAEANYKEASSYSSYKLYKSGTVWSGTESGLVFVLFNENGEQLKTFAKSTATTPTDYAATGYSLSKGRNYIFHLNGKEGTNYATQTVRLSTITLN